MLIGFIFRVKLLRKSCKSSKQDDCYLVLLEAVVQSCSVKKVFLEILQNSHESTSARVSFLIKLQALRPATVLKKNFVKFIRTPFYREHFWWLLFLILKVQYGSSHSWIFWKTLSLDCRPKGKRIKTHTTYWYKTKKNWCRYFD